MLDFEIMDLVMVTGGGFGRVSLNCNWSLNMRINLADLQVKYIRTYVSQPCNCI